MTLSPLDVSKYEFSRALRGYDPSEVRAFLERVADELSSLQTQLNTLTEQNRVFAAKLSAYQEMEQNLRDSLVATQEAARSNREQAEREREQILRETQVEADRMRLDVQREISALREELRALKVHRDAYVKRLRFLLRAHSELIDLIEQESPDITDEHSPTTDR